MAWSDFIVSCDLCDLVGTSKDPRFRSVTGAISDVHENSCEIHIATPQSRDKAVLCVRCAEPLINLARALKEKTDSKSRLDARIRAALELP